ncbi:MAG: hypothetical protein WCH34_04620 [Bacteroidota bacterium]
MKPIQPSSNNFTSEEEKAELHPFLNNEKNNPFLVPEDYFHHLPIQINNRIHAHRAGLFSLASKKPILRWALASMLILFVTAAIFLLIQHNSSSVFIANKSSLACDTNKKPLKLSYSLTKQSANSFNSLPPAEKYDLNKTIKENNITMDDVINYLDEENALDNINEL